MEVENLRMKCGSSEISNGEVNECMLMHVN